MVGEQEMALAERLRQQGRFTPVIAAGILDQIAAQLAVDREAGRTTIWIDASGNTVLKEAGSGGGGEKPVRSGDADDASPDGAMRLGDPRNLAVVLADMLTGVADANVDSATARQRLESVNMPAPVVDTVVCGLAPIEGMGFRDPSEFAAAFRQAISETADGLIAGAWEAIGRGDDSMAAVLYEMAESYATDHPEFPVLAARVEGLGSLSPTVSAASSGPVLSARGLAGHDGIASGVSTSSRPNGNPWVIFLIGAMIGVIGLLAVVAVAFTYG